MDILLDTCAFLWIIEDSKKLPQSAREVFLNPENTVFLSVLSHWEMVIKYSLKKLKFREDPMSFIPDQREKHGIQLLELGENSLLHLTKLTELHKDPFDRMLVCQALYHGMVILTPDKLISQYPLRTIW